MNHENKLTSIVAVAVHLVKRRHQHHANETMKSLHHVDTVQIKFLTSITKDHRYLAPSPAAPATPSPS